MTQPALPLHVDSTMLTCARSCLQKFSLEFVHGYRLPGVSIDLHAGACFSSAVEETRKQIWLNGKSLPEALLMAEARFFQEWGDFAPPEWKRTAKTKDRVWEAVESYFAQYAPKTDHVRPYIAADGNPTLEYTFAIPLEPTRDYGPSYYGRSETMEERLLDEAFQGPIPPAPYFPKHPSGAPFLYCGRFDLLGSYNGRPVPLDDKTTGSSIGRNWASTWDLRSQFIGYVWACQQCGIDAHELIVRGIAIQKEQIVHAEAIKQYSDELIARWYEQLRRDLWRIRRAYDENYFDFNFGDACTSYGLCPFLNTCASPNPQNWVTEFEVRHWNPLIKNPTAESGNALDSARRLSSHQNGQYATLTAPVDARSQ